MYKLKKTFALFALFFALASNIDAYRFAVYGDSRAPTRDPSAFNHTILGFINSEIAQLDPPPEFVIFVGDMVNSTLNVGGGNNLADWKAFMQSTLGDIPLYVAVGNTDLYGSSGYPPLFSNQAIFQETFNELPDNGPPNYKKLAYYFEFGQGKERSLFVVLDSFGFYEKNGQEVNWDNGYDSEQIAWFYNISASSSAHHKFGFSHGPAFSVEGFPVDPSAKVIWNLMEEFCYDIFYCGHEHVFSRWEIGKKAYPLATRTLTQTIIGSSGATPDPITNVKVNPKKAHIYSGYTYVVVDVDGKDVKQNAYAVIQNVLGALSSQHLDHYCLRKKCQPPFAN